MGTITAGIVTLLAVTGGLPEIMWLGAPNHGASARSMGMGGSGFTDISAMGALQNPALAGMAPGDILVETAGGIEFLMEKRTRRVYDRFGNSIGESEHAFNRRLGFIPAGAAVLLRNAPGLPEMLSFAAGWRVPRTFAYSYDRTIRDDAWIRTADESLEIKGLENEFCLSIAFSPSNAFSFGFVGGYITGYRNVTWEVIHVDPTVPGTFARREESFSGAVARGSVFFVPVKRISATIGVEYSMPLSFAPEDSGDPLPWNTLSDVDYDLDIPLEVKFGAIYVPGNRLRSRFTTEFTWSPYGDMEFKNESLGLNNSWTFSAGVSNTLPGGPTTRFGFSYDRSPIAAALDRMSFTGGMGFRIGEWRLDAGAAFSPQRWRQTEVTGLPSFVSGDTLSIEEADTRMLFSISRMFEL